MCESLPVPAERRAAPTADPVNIEDGRGARDAGWIDDQTDTRPPTALQDFFPH